MQVLSALLYGSTAVAMNFVNKATLAEFPLTNVLLLVQMMLALLVLPSLKVLSQAPFLAPRASQLSLGARDLNSLTVQSLGYVAYPSVTRKQAVTLLPVTILYVTNVAFALISLSTLNIVFYRYANTLS